MLPYRSNTLITESQIYKAITDTLDAGLASRGVANVAVKQWYQPRLIGAPPGMALLVSNLNGKRYGWLGRRNWWDKETQSEAHTEIQATQSFFQCTASTKQPPSPAPLLPYTGGDLAKIAATILASDAGRKQLRTAGFGIERIQEVRQPYFTDESGQFAPVASFDFTLDFNQVETTVQPTITDYELRIKRV